MKNPYTCDNCLYNPTQYHEIGTKTGFCLKHDSILKNSSHITCHFHERKDLPFFLYKDGREEHAAEFPESLGIVFYYQRYPVEIIKYSERHVWLTNTYDPYIHDVAMYHRNIKKWTFIQAFISSRNPITSVMSSSLTRRYIQQCGSGQDNYRLILSLCNDIAESLDLRMDDFIWEIQPEQLNNLREHYLKEIKLLQLYAIQEYGMLTENEDLMWIMDELNGSLFASWNEFFSGVAQLVPLINRYIIDSSQKRGTFFPQSIAGDDRSCEYEETESL
jgi:hypothetical protein